MHFAILWCSLFFSTLPATLGTPVIRVKLPDTAPTAALGRVRVFISLSCDVNPAGPRATCSDDQGTSQAFGVDTPGVGESGPELVADSAPEFLAARDTPGLKPGESVLITDQTLGYPKWSLADLLARDYCFQAELLPYTKYTRGDGAVLTLPTSCVSDGGENGQYASPDGTLYSKPITVSFDPKASGAVDIELTEQVPKAVSPGCSGKGADTEWIKTVSVDSKRLSDFWGTPMKLEACVLLPMGWYDRPTAKYPTIVAHGHYSSIFNPGGRFDDQAPPPSPTANLSGYDYYDQQAAYWLYKNWTSSDGTFHGARALVVAINHPVPMFDDSYAVDSVNVGPYGSAIIEELLPAVESKYRGIGEGWARGVLGGSTGGWEALASVVLYPDAFNYAAAACPDPIAFTSYTTVNIYEETNAYYYDSPFKRTARPGLRDAYSGTNVLPGTSVPTYGHPYGQTTATVEEMNRRELVLGERSGSCGQWDIWEAVFGPKGSNGYPARIWCKDPKACTYGEINKTVAEYWRENFDLVHIMQRDWAKGLGSKLAGKMHVFVGGSDTFYLTNAVMDLQDFAANTSLSPPFDGEIVIGVHDGRGFEHCFNGYMPDGSVAPNGVTREIYLQKFLPRMAARFAATAPPGANMEWHSY
mmetsp:Transcript_51079/g.94493  ORF Transcript_51079/g.94493 Transcript_51079/m.94493 type:complete len:642 (-) Transcript_51079:45-1970(-)